MDSPKFRAGEKVEYSDELPGVVVEGVVVGYTDENTVVVVVPGTASIANNPLYFQDHHTGQNLNTKFLDCAILEEHILTRVEEDMTIGENGTQSRIRNLASIRADFLVEKNRKYGNSALEPLGVFTKHLQSEDLPIGALLVRLDDKLKRIKNADHLRSNDIVDISGYIDLLIIAKCWDNPETFDLHKE